MTDSTDSARGPEFPADWRDRAHSFKGMFKLQAAWADGFNAARDQIRADLAPDPLGAVKVKPLEWEDFGGNGAKASGFYQASYLITAWRGQFEVAMSFPGYQAGFDGERFHDTLEAAKAAAQADYQTRIRSALEPCDPRADPRVTALVDENERLRYVLNGVKGAIKTGRNEPLVVWAEQIDIALAAFDTGGKTDG